MRNSGFTLVYAVNKRPGKPAFLKTLGGVLESAATGTTFFYWEQYEPEGNGLLGLNMRRWPVGRRAELICLDCLDPMVQPTENRQMDGVAMMTE